MSSAIVRVLVFICTFSMSMYLPAASLEERLQQAVEGDQREPGNMKRDAYRHPLETLTFMGLREDAVVVEIWPGGGWYTEILAPVLRGSGTYYAASYATTANRTPDWRKEAHMKFMEKLRGRPEVYDQVVVTELSVPERTAIAPPGSADLVLTFRNVHNWMNGDYEQQMFKVMNQALKPGGILGVVEHRARPGTSIEAMKKSGYVTEDYVIELARDAGFKLEESSEINANPADSREHPAGVWSLPPSLRYCGQIEANGDKADCVQKYLAIGESDRMTLRFRKVGD